MSQSERNSQSPVKAVCGFCGNQQFEYDRCASCGGAALEIVDVAPVTSDPTHNALIKQSVKTQKHMNLIGSVLAIGLVMVIYSVFWPGKESVATSTAETTAKVKAKSKAHRAELTNYMLLELPTEPLKVFGPSVSVGQMSFDNEAAPRRRVKSAPPSIPKSCRFNSIDLSDEFVVYAGRAVGKRLNYQINGQGKLATRVDVSVNQTRQPVILMLDTVYPTIWNIRRTRGTEIKAIFFNGENRQVLAGLDDSLPIFANTYENNYPCGRFKIEKENSRVLDGVSNALFGVDVEAISTETRSALGFGNPVNYTHKYVTDGVTLESYRDNSLPLAGKAGISQAIRSGQIRPATREDMNRWVRSAARQGYQSKDLKRIQSMFQYNAYLVLKPFTYPAALNGGSRVNFFIDKGVPLPSGDSGHSDVFDINTGTCLSTVCRMILSEW